MSFKKKKSIFRNLYPSNFAVYKEKTLADIDNSTSSSNSDDSQSQIKEETRSHSQKLVSRPRKKASCK